MSYKGCKVQALLMCIADVITVGAGKYGEAVQSYSRALERRPDTTSLWDSLAMALTALGRMDKADAAARQDPIVLRPDSVKAM